jgi:hypothetical protein
MNVKTVYYVEVTDDRVSLDPPCVWQSEIYEDRTTALKAGRRLAQEFGSSNISTLLTKGDYLNPNWIKSAKGVKRSLHVDLMIVKYKTKENYDIEIEKNIK